MLLYRLLARKHSLFRAGPQEHMDQVARLIAEEYDGSGRPAKHAH
jgi:hypothetical protein